MLLLNDSDNCETPRFHMRLKRFLPHGQDSATAGSPGRKVDQEHLVSAIVGKPAELAVELGKSEIRIHLLHIGSDLWSFSGLNNTET